MRPGLVLVLVLAAAGGCASAPRNPIDALAMHPRAVVRWPAQAGAALGCVAGLPLALALAPVTVPLATRPGPPKCVAKRCLLPIAPALLVGQAGAAALGGPPWIFFGWWGGEEDDDAATGAAPRATARSRSPPCSPSPPP